MNRPKPRKGNNAGHNLFEVLVVMVLTIVFLNLGMKLFISASQLGAYNTLHLGRASGLAEIQRQFRSAVREGLGPVDQVAQYSAGPELLIFQLPDDGAAARYCLWGTFGEEHQLVRYILRQEGSELVAESYRRFAYPADAVHFSLSENGRGASLAFSLRRDRGEREYEVPRHTIYAAFRGNRP